MATYETYYISDARGCAGICYIMENQDRLMCAGVIAAAAWFRKIHIGRITGMKIIKRGINAVIPFLLANVYLLARCPKWQIPLMPLITVLLIALDLVILAMPLLSLKNIQTGGIKRCQRGCENLYSFLAATVFSVVVLILMIVGVIDVSGWTWKNWALYILTAVVVLAVTFWFGIIRIYISSKQLGIKWRVIGILCGWIPVVHLIVLGKLIKLASDEAVFENEKLIKDGNRKQEQVCATRYPILMVHGVFFRDFRYLNYWGRIPAALEANGARIFYGNHQSAASVADSGHEIADRIKQIVQETGCGKVNIIAHSKGGLDSRYAISKLGMAPYVASLTTINTPHRGCEFADYLLGKIPEKQQQAVANAYNSALKKLGDTDPDFIAAVTDLTASACEALNREMPDPQGVYIQSTGSCMKKPSGGRFPLNTTNAFVKHFDGENDGLVGYESFKWGSNFIYLKPQGSRGISHGDVIDLNRENIDTFDVREFYVNLVSDLKRCGF